jgi:hypothetical protein
MMTKAPKVWLRSKVDPGRPGREVTEADVTLLARGAVDVCKPDGSLLLAYRPGAVPRDVCLGAREAFEPIRNYRSMNRGIASGERIRKVTEAGYLSKTNNGAPVRSAIVGFFDRYPRFPYCRKTAFNADHPLLFENGVVPLCQRVAKVYAEAVPDRYAVQMEVVRRTRPEWVIPGTPYTTLTVNHDWSTKMHQDAGDLREGFSMISCIRTGHYEGCWLVFPAFGVAADLGMGDVILFDSHEWHANTPMRKLSEDAERVSVVYYYRTKMQECLSPAEELERAKQLRGSLDLSEDDAERDPAYNEP